MKVKHLLAITLVSAGLATLLANASTPQEDIAKYTDYINQNSAHLDMVKTDYAERAIAYAKAGQWENCLKDNAWLKSNRISTWAGYRGLSDARTKAYLSLGRADEAVQDVYETFLAGARSYDLRRLKDFIAKNPQYSNYLDLNARAGMIQKYSTPKYAEAMWRAAEHSPDIRGTENSWYMLQVAEKMAESMPKSDKRTFYDVYSSVGYYRYSTCQAHPNDLTYDITVETTKENFINNGSIVCSDIMSRNGISDLYRITKIFGEICTDAFGYMRKDTKNILAIYEKQLGTGSTNKGYPNNSVPTAAPSTNASYNTNSSSVAPNYNPTATNGVFNSIQSGINTTDTMIKNVNSIKSGLRSLGF